LPAEYALANKLGHPLNVTLRQDALLPPLDEWLASKFEPPHLAATIDELLAATVPLQAQPEDNDDISGKIADCDRRLAQYRATLDAGADPATVADWITETEAERAKYQAAKQAAAPRQTVKPMSRDQLTAIVSDLSGLLSVLRDADPADKAEIYTQLGLRGLRLTYHPGERPGEGTVRTEMKVVSPGRHWQFESVRGASRPLRTYLPSRANWYLEAISDRGGGPVDPVDHDRLRSAAGADRGHGLLPAYAHAGSAAWAARLGRRTCAPAGGRDDCRCIHDLAGRLPVWPARWGASVGATGRGQRRQPGRQRRRGRGDLHWPGDRSLAELCLDRIV